MPFGTNQLLATIAASAAAVAAAAAYKRNRVEPLTVRQRDLRAATEKKPPHAIVEEDSLKAEAGGPVHRLAAAVDDSIERTWKVHPHEHDDGWGDNGSGDSGGDAGYEPDGRDGEEAIRQYEWWPR